MTPENQELIQNEIDGLNTSTQSEALKELLTNDAEARQAFDELSVVQSAFESLPERTPPPGLRASIMDSLPDLGYGAEPARAKREAAPSQGIWAPTGVTGLRLLDRYPRHIHGLDPDRARQYGHAGSGHFRDHGTDRTVCHLRTGPVG